MANKALHWLARIRPPPFFTDFCCHLPIVRPGKVLISLELLPKETADAQPVGVGRNDPNQNPYLPPPAGRMKFSFNPFRLSMSLLGPKAFYKVRTKTGVGFFSMFKRKWKDETWKTKPEGLKEVKSKYSKMRNET